MNKKILSHADMINLGVGDSKHCNYRFKTRGSLHYIVNKEDKIVSDGYHSFELFRSRDYMCIVGTLGSKSYILKLPENADDYLIASEGFHEFSYNDDIQMFLIKTGAMSYILDPVSGRSVSKGYHTIYKNSSGELVGCIGACQEIIITEQRFAQKLSNSKQDIITGKNAIGSPIKQVFSVKENIRDEQESIKI